MRLPPDGGSMADKVEYDHAPRQHSELFFQVGDGLRRIAAGDVSYLKPALEALDGIEEQLEASTSERNRLFRENLRLGEALALERSPSNPAGHPYVWEQEHTRGPWPDCDPASEPEAS